MFSLKKIVTSKTRTRLTDAHIENSLGIASSQIQPNIQMYVKYKITREKSTQSRKKMGTIREQRVLVKSNLFFFFIVI